MWPVETFDWPEKAKILSIHFVFVTKTPFECVKHFNLSPWILPKTFGARQQNRVASF